jgi:hypothetical protein
LSKSSSKYGPGIRNQHIPDPGSRGQKGTGSRIRIRNTGRLFFFTTAVHSLTVDKVIHSLFSAPEDGRREQPRLLCSNTRPHSRRHRCDFFSGPRKELGKGGGVESSGYQCCVLSVGTSVPQLSLVCEVSCGFGIVFCPDTAGSGYRISGPGSQTYIFESILKIYWVKTNNFLNIGPNICQHFKNNIGTAACTW